MQPHVMLCKFDIKHAFLDVPLPIVRYEKYTHHTQTRAKGSLDQCQLKKPRPHPMQKST